MIRWLGFVFVVLGASSVGFQMAGTIRRDLRFYRDAAAVLERMQWDISARLTPLAEAARNAAQGACGDAAELFLLFAAQIDAAPFEQMQLLMLRAVKRLGCDVPADAKRILLALCSVLGKPDVSAQVRAIDHAVALLRQQEKELEAARKTKARSYQTLGVCSGLAVAILLI